ncbi:MAG TPA: M1 family metallopeptidase [Candidatus Dormibacteraeota bacterium]|jgi:tricorn protease interacting factor F2/3|nr:M1 family metallopeptidase [Candidatus Dormibacteraeota bacterium]
MQVAAQAGQTVQQIRHYDLLFDIDFSGLTYRGRAGIDLATLGDVNLDAVGIKVENVKSGGRSIAFKQTGTVLEIQTGRFEGRLDIEFKAKVSENFTGLYKASFGEGYILTTHLEAVQARKVFPCLDHPAYKATFKITVRTSPDLKVISNMPVEQETTEDGKKLVSFQQTPKMSTYLFYLGVGKFIEDANRHGKTLLYAAHARPKGSIKTEFSFEAAQKVLDFYESYFGIPYQLPKLHQIAVPEFAYGAMENWGAITYREILIHVDKDTSIRAKKAVAGVIAHEIAHMWFGDLVTMRWWDDIWLNESFATFMGHKAVDNGFPQWKIWQDFVRTQTSGAMGRDALKNTHPIEAHVKDPEEIEELFDEISYGKGASILRMIEAYIGPDAFQKGVSKYLEKFRYSNASGHDLWNHLQEASGTGVNQIMESWIGKAGFPIVAATLSNGNLRLEQERFLLAGGTEKQTWPIPVTMTVDGKPQRILFDKNVTEINVGSPKALKLNVDQTGFYVVNYKSDELQQLVWKSRLSPLDKWGLVSDAKALLLSGHLPVKQYMTILERYQNEDEYLPAFEASDQLELLHVLAPEKIREVSRRFHSAQLKRLMGKQDENSSLLKGIVAGRLVLLDDPYAKDESSKLADIGKVEPDMKRPAVMGYARTSNDYNGLVERFRNSSSDEERLRYLEGLASFKKPDLVGRTLEFSLSGQVKKQDVRNVVAYATGNADARDATWKWFKTNIRKLDDMYRGTAQLSTIMRGMISIAGVGRVHEAETLFEEHPLPAAEATLERMRIYDRLAKNLVTL